MNQYHCMMLIALLGFLAVAGFLWRSSCIYGLGYPLDDAWIHQTYARNLVQYGEWSFIPGTPSAGSTAPLWTTMIAFGLALGLDPAYWTYGIGLTLLVLLGWLCFRWFTSRSIAVPPWGCLLASLVVLEWHLVWAAVSGMETLAFSALCVAVLWLMEKESWKPISIGILIGIGVWLRPGAITLILPLGIIMITRRKSMRWESILAVAFGMAVTIGPYLVFNYLLTDRLWPNTFYAKQSEYAILRQTSLITRFGKQLVQPLVGVGSILIPGVFLIAVRNVRERDWMRLAPIVWVFAYLGMYAERMPVTYQHGRYAIPVIPVLLVVGMGGVARWAQLNSPITLRRFVSRFWILSSLAILTAFLFIGATAYGEDVAIIETEMVAAAKWIAGNTESSALVAAHDIGALGYFGERDLVDLAGLVSPEVIPFIRDEDALTDYLDQRAADYLLTFPGWYPRLVQEAVPIYVTEGEFSPAAGGENMVLYQWGR
jgi:hypothetical protein